MKNKSKHRSNKNNKRLKIRQCSSYEPDFKKAVVLYAEQKSTSEAKRRYGISESNIRRWRRLKNEILEKASQTKSTRKSKRTNHLFEGCLEDIDPFDLPSSLDSMPLEQRLTKTPAEQEPVLQSQPLSPTKLKVTRQAAKPSQPSPKPPTPEPPNEEVCLRWNSHHSNMQSTFPNLLLREQYVDATLVAEGQTLKCHRLILSSCSPYFEEVLSGISPFQHPVLFMKDIPFWILKSLCDFMYAGEVHIFQNKLEELLAVAEMLKIKGLAGKTEGGNEEMKAAEPLKDEKKDEKEAKDKKKHTQSAQPVETSAPRTSAKSFKSSHTSRKVEKVHKEIVNSDDILDPLDLLEPVYEELTEESKPANVSTKYRESKSIPMKKGLPKKLKKRKLSEEREESPPPMFLSRKGTRSRPNVKIPKYYHTHYERVSKEFPEFPESTIVREPHTDQADPLMEVEEIKAEPLDFQDDVIEIEDNVVSFSDQEMPSLQEEEIFSNYNSPMVNVDDNNIDGDKEQDQTSFKKISLLPQPIIMDVHSVSEKSPNTLRIVDVEQIKTPTETVNSKLEDPLATEITMVELETSKEADDPLNLSTESTKNNTDDITITNVESIAESGVNGSEEQGDNKKFDFPIERVLGENEEIKDDKGAPNILIEKVASALEEVKEGEEDPDLHIVKVVSEVEEVKEADGDADASFHSEKVVNEKGDGDGEPSFLIENASSVKEGDANEGNAEFGFHIAKVASEQFALSEEDKSDEKDVVIREDCASELGFQITNIVSGHFEDLDGKVCIEDSPPKDSNSSELETIVNNLSDIVEESHGKKDVVTESSSDLASMNSTLSDDAKCIAESLEELLDK